MAESPGEGQAPGQAGDQPAEPSSESAQRHGAAPGKGNTPARTPLTPYKRWTTPTAQASVNVRQEKPAGESHFRKACAWKRETLKAKEMPKAKKEKAKSRVLRAKGKKKERRREEKGQGRPRHRLPLQRNDPW